MDTPEYTKYNESTNSQESREKLSSSEPSPVTPDSLSPSSPTENNAYTPMEETQKDKIIKQTTEYEQLPKEHIYIIVSILIGYPFVMFILLFFVTFNIYIFCDAIISLIFATLFLYYLIRNLEYQKSILVNVIFAITAISLVARFRGFIQALDEISKISVIILIFFGLIDFCYSIFRCFFIVVFFILRTKVR